MYAVAEEQLAQEQLSGPQPRLYSTSELAAAVGVPAERVCVWVTTALLTPSRSEAGEHFFPFRQLTLARTLVDLTATGFTPRQLRRQIARLRRWPGHEQAAVVDDTRRLLVRLPDGDLAETDGQLRFDFAEGDALENLKLDNPPMSADQWRDLAREQDADGKLAESAESYRQALAAGGFDAATAFELAHVLARAAQPEAAIERYRQVIEAEPTNADAYNNWGVLLVELGRREEALEVFRRAVRESDDARAHYNLADTLDELGRNWEATPHWQAYLRHDHFSEWAQHAKRRLG